MARRPTRREILKGGAAGLVTAGLPGCKDEAGEAGDSAGPGQIDHVIVLMMENRSFDHYLGSLKLLEGLEVDGLTGDESNLDLSGDPQGVFALQIDCQADPPHGWSSSHNQFNDGANDGFVAEHAARVGEEEGVEVMGYYTRDDLPISYALADAYALPDAWFCSVMSSTWPNRFYGHAGTSDGQKNNEFPLDGSFSFKTVYNALDEAGLDWAYYYTDLPFIGLFKDHWDATRIHLIEDFIQDALDGNLPPFTWIDPGFSYNDDHPPHHPGLGQMFLAMIYEALAQSPLWERCLLVITYDEHGGFYDHVAPPTVDDDHAEDGFDQLGFRVPVLVVGPWVKPGVNSTLFDNTSTLKYVCDRFGLEPWTARIAGANSIEALLDADRMAAGEPLSPVALPAFEVPDSEILDDCQYGGRSLSGQPELERWVELFQPEASRLGQIPEIHQRMLALARKLKLLE